MNTNHMRLMAQPQTFLPLVSLIVGGSLVASQTVLSSQAAPQTASAGSCTLIVPTRYAINSPYHEVPASRGADCASAGVVDARWEARRSSGAPMYQLVYRWNYPDTWDVFDESSLQVWTWHPMGATTGDITLAKSGTTPAPTPQRSNLGTATSVTQNAPATDVRMASRLSLGWVPADSAVTTFYFTVHSDRYAITPMSFINYAGAKGSIQKRSGTNGWSVAENFTLDSEGDFGVILPRPTVRTYYRAVVYDSQYIFGGIYDIGHYIDPK